MDGLGLGNGDMTNTSQGMSQGQIRKAVLLSFGITT
jgi:hypothetical protein